MGRASRTTAVSDGSARRSSPMPVTSDVTVGDLARLMRHRRAARRSDLLR
jgi:hypothetical protein